MPLYIVTAPPGVEPVTLAEAKAQLRVVHSSEDELIQGYIATARNYVENKTWRQLMRATLRLDLDRFPSDRWIYLPRPRLVSVSSIEYLSGGEWATLAAERYVVDATSEPGRVRVDASGWPTVDDELAAVRITYLCGWLVGDVPPQLKTAISLLVSGYYYNREGVLPVEVFDTVDALIDDFSIRSLVELPYLAGTDEALSLRESGA